LDLVRGSIAAGARLPQGDSGIGKGFIAARARLPQGDLGIGKGFIGGRRASYGL